MSDPGAQRRIRVVAAVIESEGQYLITQRRPTAVLPLLWEFPGGRAEEHETDAEALAREVRYRIGMELTVGTLISFISHSYERYVVELHLYQCSVAKGEPEAINVNDFAWIGSEQFEDYWFTPADEASVVALLGLNDDQKPNS